MAIVDCTVAGHICPIVDVSGADKHFGEAVQLDSDETDIQALIDGGHITVP